MDGGGKRLSFTKAKSNSTRHESVMTAALREFQLRDPQNFKEVQAQSLV